MNFLPENYEAPKSSNYYMKLQEGENRIRIMSAPVLGWEDWTEDKKPIRFKFENKPASSVDPKKPARHFWAFIVFNYGEEQIQIMHVTQATIRKAIESLCKDKDWGAPYGYDIKIVKTGEKVDTEYTVNPVPHKAMDPYIVKCFNDRRINLNAIYSNADPFAPDWDSYTPLAVSNAEPSVFETKEKAVAPALIKELRALFDECDPTYQEQLMATLAKLPQVVKRFEDIPASLFDKVKNAVKKKRDEYQALIKEDLFAAV